MPTPYESARAHQRAGLNRAQVRNKLLAEGVDNHSAQLVVASVFSNPEPPAHATYAPADTSAAPASDIPSASQLSTSGEVPSAGSGEMLVPLIMIGVGIAITLGTLMFAAPGGTYIIAWGPIVFGVLRLIRAGSR